jgi:hypothetical protein
MVRFELATSLAYPSILLHYYTDYIYITVSFTMYYNKTE